MPTSRYQIVEVSHEGWRMIGFRLFSKRNRTVLLSNLDQGVDLSGPIEQRCEHWLEPEAAITIVPSEDVQEIGFGPQAVTFE